MLIIFKEYGCNLLITQLLTFKGTYHEVIKMTFSSQFIDL